MFMSCFVRQILVARNVHLININEVGGEGLELEFYGFSWISS